MNGKELTVKEAVEHIAKRLWEALEKNKGVRSAGPGESIQSHHIEADDIHPDVDLCGLYGHNWGDSEDGLYFCIRCGEEQF